MEKPVRKLEEWKKPEVWPDCRNFVPSREEVTVSIPYLFENRNGFICIKHVLCRNFNFFECVVSKDGYVDHVGGRKK